MRITWVHPSWRDLVVDELAADATARRAFLSACELPGAVLAVSVAGGARGERRLPLMVDDADWDVLGDTVHRLCRELGHDDVARLLGALETAAACDLANAELQALAELALSTTHRRLDHAARPLAVHVLEAWLRLGSLVPDPGEAPALRATWEALAPRPGAAGRARLHDWRTLVVVLREHVPYVLADLGYPERYRGWILAGDEELFEPQPDVAGEIVTAPVISHDAEPDRIRRILADL